MGLMEEDMVKVRLKMLVGVGEERRRDGVFVVCIMMPYILTRSVPHILCAVTHRSSLCPDKCGHSTEPSHGTNQMLHNYPRQEQVRRTTAPPRATATSGRSTICSRSVSWGS
jgi:hypothetical protein